MYGDDWDQFIIPTLNYEDSDLQSEVYALQGRVRELEAQVKQLVLDLLEAKKGESSQATSPKI